MTRGILYIATGERFTREARKSAQSVHKDNDYPIAIFTDCVDQAGSVFTETHNIESNPKKKSEGKYNKIKYMNESPFDKTLFLDTDTYINSDISDIFELLDAYDVGMAQDPSHSTKILSSVPKAFPEYNTGVLVYNDNKNVDRLFNNWRNIYSEIENDYDQPAFRKAVYETNINYITLTREWNCFYNFSGYVSESPRILHGRYPSPKRAANIIQGPGIYFRTWFQLQQLESKPHIPEYIGVIHTSLEENGLLETIKKSISTLIN